MLFSRAISATHLNVSSLHSVKQDAAPTGNVAIATEVRSTKFPQYLLSFQAEYVILRREISICRRSTAFWTTQLSETRNFRSESCSLLPFVQSCHLQQCRWLRSSRMISLVIQKVKMIKLTFELNSKLLSSQFVLLSIVLTLEMESGESNGP